MGMTIETVIRNLSMYDVNECGNAELHTWYKGIEEDMEESFELAIDIMRKYQMMQADYNARLKADMVAMLKEIREEIEHCSSRYNLAREQGCQGQVVWSEYLYKQGDVSAILDKKISELEGKNVIKEN